MKRNYVAGLVVLAGLGACGGGKQSSEPARKMTALAEALRPEFFANAVRRMGGAHFHGTAHFGVGPAGTVAGVTTTTDVWVDRSGNYRLRENNDRDGGREVVLHGRELSVALRYGKMIRRIAEEPEPGRLLTEALGAPFAAFELCAPRARVTQAGSELYGGAKATVFELALAEGAASPARKRAKDEGPEGSRPLVGLRAWRSTASIEGVSGRMVVDDATGAVVRADLSTRFSAKGEGGQVSGTVDVHTALTEIASTAAIERPEAEELVLRQRIVPEQRELLRGIAQARPPAEATRRGPPRREPSP